MAEHAIISHKASLKHKATVDTVNQRISIKNFFSNATSTAQQEEKPAENVDNAVLNLTEKVTDKAELTQNNNKTGSQLTMSFYTSKNETTKAEIIWCFNSVYNHLSQSAAGKSVDVMKLMFTDSEIAAAMKLSRTKIGYTIAYGLGPYFQSQLLDEIRDSHHFCVSFDESLNTISQKEQQDIWVRFWSKVSHRPETRYIGSAFLGHTKASDLINGYKCQLKSIDLTKMINISMDGPNVNFKFLNDLQKDLKDEHGEHFNLFDTGSCGIHTVHNAFKTAFQNGTWAVSSFLRAIYNVFNNSPARKSDYIEFTSSTVFPLEFCSTRWVENIQVAERAKLIVPNLKQYLEGVKKAKIKITSNSFKIMENHLEDKLLEAKLCFFIVLANEVEPFLRKFQTDKPMFPYLYTELNNILTNVMSRFIKKEVIESSVISKIDLKVNENFMHTNKINIGYSTQLELKKNKGINDKDILLFKRDCLNIFKSFVEKIIEKSPIKYKIVKASSFCDPKIIINNETVCLTRLKSAIEIFMEKTT